MARFFSLAGAVGVAFVCSSTSHAQHLYRSHVSPDGANGGFGQSVTAIGDVTGDLIPDYAVGGYLLNVPMQPNAGAVHAFSGATGAQLWTVGGTGGWTRCAGGTWQDWFGWDLALIPDQTGDGVDDLLVGAPGFGVVNGPCKDDSVGAAYIVDAVTGFLFAQQDVGAASGDLFGDSVERCQDMTGDMIDEFIIVAPGQYARVYDGSTGVQLYSVALGAGDTVVVGAGNFDLIGTATEVAIGNAGAASVRIVDAATGGTVGQNSGPAGSDYGFALESTSFGGYDGVLIGAPREAGQAGAVYHWNVLVHNVRIDTGAAGDFLGYSLAYGGDGDGDGAADDLLVGAPGGAGAKYVRMLTLDAGPIRDYVEPGSLIFGLEVAWLGEMVGNAFDEFIVGDFIGMNTGGEAFVMFGGPSTLNQNFGPGCNQNGTANPPVLTQSAPLNLGAPFSFTLSAPPGGQSGVLYVSLANGTGFPIGACQAWLDPAYVAQMASFIVPVGAPWTSPVYTMPNNPAYVGLTYAHQVHMPGSDDLSNAVSSMVKL